VLRVRARVIYVCEGGGEGGVVFAVFAGAINFGVGAQEEYLLLLDFPQMVIIELYKCLDVLRVSRWPVFDSIRWKGRGV